MEKENIFFCGEKKNGEGKGGNIFFCRGEEEPRRQIFFCLREEKRRRKGGKYLEEKHIFCRGEGKGGKKLEEENIMDNEKLLRMDGTEIEV